MALLSTQIPQRIDRLPWTGWHWTVVIGLGITWILDGLEVTIVGGIAGRVGEKGAGVGISAANVSRPGLGAGSISPSMAAIGQEPPAVPCWRFSP